MSDPKRLFDAKDIQAAALYAQRVAGTDFFPLKLDADGYLLTNLTVGTINVSNSDTSATITNSASNPVPVTGNVNVSSATLGTVVIQGNVNIATATLGTVVVTGTVTPSTTGSTITNAPANPVNVSLTNTQVSVSNAAGVFNVNIRTATLGTVAISGTVTPSTTGSTITNAVGNPANVSLVNTGVTVSVGRTLTGCTVSISATTGTVTTAGTNRIKVYAISVTTTATTSSVISFINGTYGGLVLWKAVLQAPSGANAGLNLAVTPPAYLFATGSAQLLRLNQTSAIPVEVSVSYFDEA